ncbi:MAG: hypothetical protein RLN62_02320 [Rickettsiales bacterium]
MPFSFRQLENIKSALGEHDYPRAIVRDVDGRICVIADADIDYFDAVEIDTIAGSIHVLPSIDICRFEHEYPVYSRSVLAPDKFVAGVIENIYS